MAKKERLITEDDVVDNTTPDEEIELEDDTVEQTIEEDLAARNRASVAMKPTTKMGAISGIVNLMTTLPKDTVINKFYEMMNQIGHEADSIPSGSADKNRASIACGKAVKEEVEEVLKEEALSDEQKERLSTIFESSVNARISLEVESLREEFETSVQEQVAEEIEALEDKIDMYLNYVVENWVQENEVAIESTLTNELQEEFISDLADLMRNHHIDIPEDKVDILEDMAVRIEELENRLNESESEKIILQNEMKNFAREEMIDEAAHGLSRNQAARLRQLSEGIEFDPDTFGNKLEILREKFFPLKEKNYSTNLLVEESDFEEEPIVNKVPVGMQTYVKAIEKTSKK